jgi:translation initiation factor IF-3
MLEKEAALKAFKLNEERAAAERTAREKAAQASDQEVPTDERITAPEMVVIDENGVKLGVMARRTALDTAKQRGLNLMQVSRAGAVPIVCRIVSLSRQFSERLKREKEQRKKARQRELKTIQHDATYKMKQGAEFLKEGHVVRVAILFVRPPADDSEASAKIAAEATAASALFARMVEKLQLDEIASWDSDPTASFASRGYITMTPLSEKEIEKRLREKNAAAAAAAKAVGAGSATAAGAAATTGTAGKGGAPAKGASSGAVAAPANAAASPQQKSGKPAAPAAVAAGAASAQKQSHSQKQKAK